MIWRDPKFKYTPSHEMKEGYLREKFRRMQKAMEQPKPAKTEPTPIRKVANG